MSVSKFVYRVPGLAGKKEGNQVFSAVECSLLFYRVENQNVAAPFSSFREKRGKPKLRLHRLSAKPWHLQNFGQSRGKRSEVNIILGYGPYPEIKESARISDPVREELRHFDSQSLKTNSSKQQKSTQCGLLSKIFALTRLSRRNKKKEHSVS